MQLQVDKTKDFMRNELSHDPRITSTLLIPSDHSDLNSIAFSPIGGGMSCYQSQVSRGLSCSPILLTLSGNGLTPLGGRSRNELPMVVAPFESVLQVKPHDNTNPPFDLPRSQNQTRETEHRTEEISRSDIGYLRSLIPAEDEKVGNREKSRRAKKTAKAEAKMFACKYCEMIFCRSQALGGHMSRAHPGKSCEYKKKKNKRKSREVERLKLLIAKRKYFRMLSFDYDELFTTPEGRKKAQGLIDRTAIKKIKRELTKEEIDNFFENKILDEIKQDS